MLNYAPDGMTGGSALGSEGWSVSVDGQGLPDEGALMRLVGAARGCERVSVGFQPERVSGFCAV